MFLMALGFSVVLTGVWPYLDKVIRIANIGAERLHIVGNICLNFHINLFCPTKTITIFHDKEKNTWITKGILLSREKLKMFLEI